MAKAKSSQQINLSKTNTGIDMTEGLGFGKSKNVDNLVADNKAPDKKDVSVDNLVVEKPVEATVNHPAKSDITVPSAKLTRPETVNFETTTIKISALISPKAKENLEKYARIYGYKKLSPFINDLFERLDAYMD